MKKPDKIYVHTGAHLGMLTLTTIPVGVTDEQEYIRKDALLEWAEEKYNEYDRRIVGFPDDGAYWGQRNAFRQIIDKLNSM